MRLRAWAASRGLFRALLRAVLHAPMAFFDTTPLGRITNRFSKVTDGVVGLTVVVVVGGD